MSKILELREKRAKVWEAAKAFLDSKRGNDGLLSPEDTATYEKMEAEVIALGKEIERLERQAAIDFELSKPLNIPITDKPTSISGNNEKTGRASDEYRQSFWNMMRGRRKYDVHNALQIGEDTEGGYLVPDDFERTLVEALEEENIFRQIANVITTSSGDKKIPVVASKGTASWVDEEGQIPESDDSFAQVSIGAYKLATMIKVSEELLNDSVFNLEQYIAKEFARRIGAKEEEAFFIGDGSGKPTGILADNGGGEIGVTAASATAITLDEIMDLFYSLKSPYRRNAVFIMNDSTIKAIRKLKDNNGQYLWQPSVTAGTPDTILNRPVKTSAFMPAIAAGAKTIVFGDFSYYWVADRQGRVFKRLNELYAATGQVGFIATQRVDGKLILPESIKYLQMKASSVRVRQVRVLAVSLEEAKLYLRVDGGEEDALIAALIETASELCEGVLRMSLEDFEETPKSVNQAILYITANLYEHREELDMKVVEDVVKRLLSPFRKEGW
jgi:HK97 family phage major capsid protein